MSEHYESFGYALAMSVLQSDLYTTLDDRERAECDELIARGQGKRRPSRGGTMRESETPRTDLLHRQLVKRSENLLTWVPGKDYVDMRAHAEQLETELAATREELRIQDEANDILTRKLNA